MENIKRFEVQLTPELRFGKVQHYWHIYVQDGNNKITLQHGWASTVIEAFQQGHKAI